MTCTICDYIGQFFLNLLVLMDHIGNTVLLGDPDETLSARTARARTAGSKIAAAFCSVLTFLQKIVTFGKMTSDHCTYAVSNSGSPLSKEIWDWSNDTIDDPMISPVDPVEVNDD